MDQINDDVHEKDKPSTPTKPSIVPKLNLPGSTQGLQRRGTATPSSARRIDIHLETLHESDYLDDSHN